MKPSEDLHELIHSMTAAERRHFKLNARRYSPSGQEKKYILLFDAVAAQVISDEALLRKSLADEIPETSFSSWKRHLLHYLEAAIREFHAGKHSTEVVYEKLRDADLLYRRGLWSRAQKKITESRELAKRLGDLHALLKINDTERWLMIEFEERHVEAKMASLMAESHSIFESLQTEFGYAEIFAECGLLVRLRFDPRHPQVAEAVPRLLQDKRLQPQATFPNFKSQRYYHQARAFVFHLADRPEDELQEYIDLLLLWERNHFFQAVFPKIFKLSLTNFLHAAIKLKRWGAIPKTLQRIAALPAESRDEAAEDFQTVEFYKHLYYLDSHQLAPALAMVPSIEAGLLEYAPKVNHARWLAFKVNLAITHFLCDDMRLAFKQVDEILAHPKSEHRSDAQTLARLLEPIILYSLGNVEFAHLKLRALREWLRTNARFFDFERLVLSKLEYLLNAEILQEHAILADFHKALVQFDARHPGVPGVELLLIWADARGTGKSMRAIYEATPQEGLSE